MKTTHTETPRYTSERVMLAALALAAAALLGIAVAAEGATHPDELEIPELREIRVPEAERMELENGIVVYVLEDRDLPMVEIRTLTRGGTAFDPEDKIGLASITAQVMRAGGSERYPGDELDLAVESVGTELSMSAGERFFTGSLSTLSDQLDAGLDILADVMRSPSFPEEKIAEVKQQVNTGIASRNDQPIGILQRELAKLVFGSESPYGWHTEYATIAAIGPEDLRAAHARFFHPELTTVVAWGDVSAKELRESLVRVFGDWASAGTKLEAPPGVPAAREAALYYAEKTDVTQSTIAVGGIGIQQSDPIYPAAKVCEAVLGGGFSSRLFAEIRTRRGLAYATGAFVNAPLSRPGISAGYVLTQADSTVTSLELLLGEIRRMRTEPISEEELQLGKDKILNSFVFEFDSPGQVVLRAATYELFGYDADFLTRYQDAVARVTTDDVMRAAQTLFQPEAWQILVIGNDETFARPLSDVMPVTELDISIPDPPVVAAPVPPATPESLARGQEIIAEVIDAHGGREALESVESFTVVGNGTANAQGMQLQIGVKETYVLPDRYYSEQTVFGQKMLQVIDRGTGWMKGPQGVVDLSADQVASSTEDELLTGGIRFLLRAEDLEIQALEPETIGETTYDVVYIRDLEDRSPKLYVDPRSRMIVRASYRGKHPMTQAPADIVMTFAEHRGMGGLTMPHETEMLVDGEPFLSMTIDEVRVNEEVDPGLFVKPEGS